MWNKNLSLCDKLLKCCPASADLSIQGTSAGSIEPMAMIRPLEMDCSWSGPKWIVSWRSNWEHACAMHSYCFGTGSCHPYAWFHRRGHSQITLSAIQMAKVVDTDCSGREKPPTSRSLCAGLSLLWTGHGVAPGCSPDMPIWAGLQQGSGASPRLVPLACLIRGASLLLIWDANFCIGYKPLQ